MELWRRSLTVGPRKGDLQIAPAVWKPPLLVKSALIERRYKIGRDSALRCPYQLSFGSEDRRPTKVAWHRIPFDRLHMATEKAMFGAGCFWGVEETFRNLKGVTSTAVGYAGGKKEDPTYEDVCTDETGHAEVVEVEYDPDQVSYDQLLDVFWSNHNPTTPNRQGPDVGTQYRSVIFYHSPEQKAAAEASKAKLDQSGRFPRPVVTQIEAAPKFWRAEDYHQRYLAKRGQSHCAI